MRKLHFIALLLAALFAFALPAPSSAQISVGIAAHVGPPALPVYSQPLCPGPGFIWAPGYWAYGPDGYYWVPGTWMLAPAGMLWTPGYWGWGEGAYLWHAGYWGPHVGFYGGINYGYGYGGVGFGGGRWNHGVFAYNSAVSHVDVTVIHNTYVDKTVIVNNNTTINRVSYNGGEGGVASRPTPDEMAAEHERHQPPLATQTQHEHAASTNHAFLASENHGHPTVAATARPGDFSHGVPAHGAENFHPPAHNDNPHPGNGGAPPPEHHSDAHNNNGEHSNPHPEANHNNDNRGPKDDRGGDRDHH
jgi:hypothetical protein